LNALAAVSNGMQAVKLCSKNPPFLTGGCQLTKVGPYDGHKTIVVVVVVVMNRNSAYATPQHPLITFITLDSDLYFCNLSTQYQSTVNTETNKMKAYTDSRHGRQ